MRNGRILLLLLLGTAAAQDAPPNGPRRVDPAWHALVGATVHVAPGNALANANVVLRDGSIVSVSQDAPPKGARTWDLTGKHLYAGLIDAYVEVDPPAHKGRHWNPKVTPRRLAREASNATAKELRELGFTAAAVTPKSGILRGQASIVALTPHDDDKSVARPRVYREALYQALAFERNRRGADGFPTAQMGAIALIRQSIIDGLVDGQPLWFDVDDELEALRADRIAREFEKPAVIVGSGLEFRRLAAIVAAERPLIVPLRFPRAPDVSSVGAENETDLRTMMTWEQAPTNPRRLADAGLTVALTTSKLKRKRFWRHVAKAIRHGLDEEQALAMLTTHPAKILGVSNLMGTVEAGKAANLVVTDGPLFERHRTIESVWIEGKHHEITPHEAEIAGTWEITAAAMPKAVATVGRQPRHGGPRAIKVKLDAGEKKAKRVRVRDKLIHFAFESGKGLVTLSGVVEGDTIDGHGTAPDGSRFAWSAARTAPPPARRPRPASSVRVPKTYGTPFGPYALDAVPGQRDVIVRGATVWTSGPQGIIENGEIEVSGGKLTYVGPARDGGDNVINAAGKHLTPGIVDCHSHTGISKGINDSGQAVTAEVRIGDVTNPDHISWYRQLAGGVTTVNSLHGSANPIGGQNQVNKNRWGAPHPTDLHFEGAPEGIKFALGENVKQSNWGDDYTVRYPQTRMGVETLMRDRFMAAREYLKGHDRRDLELEALGEILEGKRLIHCHSYRQDEILMLCRLAKEFGFKIGTFQHVLEGYKVAEAIRDHAIGGSAFSDWWAYKLEVQDAIPYNGALMRDVGVVVSFNSDSNELARRMNLEAAKAVKYGGVEPPEALKFVTLNAAIQLGIGDRIGSLETGKDADFALWSGDPLSTYSRCEATWIDGREYFSIAQDQQHREKIAAERRRLIQKLLGRKTEKEEKDEEEEEDKDPARRKRVLAWLRGGAPPEGPGCDECDRMDEEVGR